MPSSDITTPLLFCFLNDTETSSLNPSTIYIPVVKQYSPPLCERINFLKSVQEITICKQLHFQNRKIPSQINFKLTVKEHLS